MSMMSMMSMLLHYRWFKRFTVPERLVVVSNPARGVLCQTGNCSNRGSPDHAQSAQDQATIPHRYPHGRPGRCRQREQKAATVHFRRRDQAVHEKEQEQDQD